MKKNSELKNTALSALKGNWAPSLIGSIFISVATGVLMAPAYCANMASFGMPVFSAISPVVLKVFTNSSIFINIFLLYPLMLGYTVAHNDLLVSGDARVTSNTIRHTFSGYLKNVGAMLLVYLFAALWALLLIIPGIIKGLAYSMTPFIIKEYPELSANQAIDLSIKMMKGHKFDLFYLYLSFLGWIILSMLTLGIGLLWVIPYMQTTVAAFYQEVKAEYISSNINN